MSQIGIEPAPFATDLLEQGSKRMSSPWMTWLMLALIPRLISAASTVFATSLTAQNAAIGTTVLKAAAAGGVYRIGWYTRITIADGVASSVTVRIHTTDGGNAITQTGAAVVGDTVTTVQSGVIEARVDDATSISYSTLYASTTPNKMNYALDLTAEAVAA